MSLFVNGIRVDSKRVPLQVAQNVKSFALGSYLVAQAHRYVGFIDEVRISNIARYTKNFTPAKRFEPDKETLALYHFDEGRGTTLTDHSGNGHHGKIHGATWVNADGSAIKPPKNHALKFDGKTSDVVLPTLKYDASHPLTIEAWVESTGNNVNPRIIGNDGRTGTGGQGGLTIQINADPISRKNRVGFLLEAGKRVFHATNLPPGRHHLALVCDREEARFYLDGKKAFDRVVKYADFGRSAVPFRMGTHPGGGDRRHRFQGTIDEVRFSKVARYTKNFTPAKRFEPDKDTVALYHFDEGRGNVLKDSSGNSHHGKIHSATWVTDSKSTRQP